MPVLGESDPLHSAPPATTLEAGGSQGTSMTTRALWIAGVVALALLSYGLGLVGVSPSRATGREYWHAAFGKSGVGYPHPFGPHYLLLTERGGRIQASSCPADEVEAALPGFLRALQPEPWFAEVLDVVDPESPPPVQELHELLRRGRLNALSRDGPAFLGQTTEERVLSAHRLEERLFTLSHHLRWKAESQLLHLGIELGVWTALLLLLCGTHPPGEGPPQRAALRAGLFVLLLYATLWCWLATDREIYVGEASGWCVPFTAFDLHGLPLASIDSLSWGWARLLGLVLGASATAAALSWAWNRPRPRSLLGCVAEASLLGLPLALGLWWLSDPLLLMLQRDLPPPSLVPFWLALPLSLQFATSAGALALRLQLSPPRQEPDEREPLRYPLRVGARRGVGR